MSADPQKTVTDTQNNKAPQGPNDGSSSNDLPDAPKPQFNLKPQPELPDAPQPQASPAQKVVPTLKELNEALKRHKIHPDVFSLNYEPIGTRELISKADADATAVHPARTSQTVNLPDLPAKGVFQVDSATITPKFGASVDFPLSPHNHRSGPLNGFEGAELDAQQITSLGASIRAVTREEAHAGDAYYFQPRTTIMTVPASDPSHPQTTERTHHVFKTGPDVGGSASVDVKIPTKDLLPFLPSHLPEKSFGKDNLVTVGAPQNIDLTGYSRFTTIETGATAGVSVPLAKVLDGGITISESYNPHGTTAFSNAGWQATTGLNTIVDVTDTTKVKHGLSALLGKVGGLFHHHHKDQQRDV